MKSIIKDYLNKIRCIVQRIRYKFLFYGINIDPWHLKGTFYCRKYKIKTLEIINKIKPNYYIDIGCGIGEILNRVELSSKNKFGFDIDERLAPAINRIKGDFNFSSDKKKFYNLLKEKIKGQKNKIIVTLLGFSHKISDRKLIKFSAITVYIGLTIFFFSVFLIDVKISTHAFLNTLEYGNFVNQRFSCCFHSCVFSLC